MKTYKDKCFTLLAAMDRYTKADCIVAFSGGADSSLVLKLACELAAPKGTKVYAVTLHTELHPMNDLAAAQQVAKEMGAIHQIIVVDELKGAGIGNNPVNRCYLCKKYMFERILKAAAEKQIHTILEGTNDDDLYQYRPGILALKELQITSPLAEALLTKAEVRKLAAEHGISVANRPAAPCLATRFPYDTPLSYPLMRKVEDGESFLRDQGFYNVRLRLHGDIVRIEVDPAELAKFMEQREDILAYLKAAGFVYITLDLEGFRSGSMDRHTVKVLERHQ